MISKEYENNTMLLTIDRAAQRNALSIEMYDALRVGVQQAHDDPNCHSVIITGSGGNFTSGNDIKDFQRPRPSGDSAGLAFLRTLANVDVAVIAAVEGHAIGIGCTLLQHCDFVYADDTATFSLPFISLALCPEGGSSLILEQLAGRRKAAQWLMLGEKFDVQEALEAGFVTAVSERGRTLADARKTADTLASKPIKALRVTKNMLREPGRPALMDAFDNERDQFKERLNSDEAQAIFKGFFDRKKG